MATTGETQILRTLAADTGPGRRAGDLAQTLGLIPGNVRVYLLRMAERGAVRSTGELTFRLWSITAKGRRELEQGRRARPAPARARAAAAR